MEVDMKLDTVNTIGVIGAGMIGDSLTVLTTGHGYRTVNLVRNEQKIPGYKQQYDTYFRQMIDHGLLDEAQWHVCEKYLTYSLDYQDLKDCDVIFECIVEDLDQKHEVYRKIEENCPNVKAICSVSSSFLSDDLGAGLEKYYDRVLVTHPFNPAHMVPYFEICAGSRTAEGVVDFVIEVLRSLDRQPAVLKKPNPGFIGNYLQFALWAACLKLVQDGVCEPKDIDTCLNYSFCPRYTSIGIFDHFDNGGYKLNITTCNAVFPILPRWDEAPEIIREKAESPDAWGAKSPTKKGFYDWNGVDMAAYAERVNEPYWKFCKWDYPKE